MLVEEAHPWIPYPWKICSECDLEQFVNRNALPPLPTHGVGVEESTWRPDNALKHIVVELDGRFHADDKEVNGPDHGDDTESAHNGPIDTKVEVMLSQIIRIQFDPGS